MSERIRVPSLKQAALSALVLLLVAAPLVADTGGTKTATTVWWVVFNHPENCATSPCEIDDLAVPAVEGLESEQNDE